MIKANITEIKEILKNELITVKEFEETKEPNYKDYLKSINTKAVGKDYEVHTHKNKAEFNDTVYNETLSKAEDNNYKKSSIDRYDSLDNQYTDSKYAEFFTKTQPEVFKKSMFEQTWFKERFVDSIIKEFHVLKKDKE